MKLLGGIVRDYHAIIIGLLKVNGDNRQISEVLTVYMVTTRSMAEAAKEAAENSVLQNQDQEENIQDEQLQDLPVEMEMNQGSINPTQQTTDVDPLWAKLMRLPFFAGATLGEQKAMYMEEVDREQERERRFTEAERVRRQQEFELEKLRITSNTLPGPSATSFARKKLPVSLPEWESKTKMDKYLSTCERLLTAAKVDEEGWVTYILPKLPEKARTVYNRLPIEKANHYQALKRSLLDAYSISPLIYRQNFFQWKKRGASFADFLNEIEEQLDLWLHCVVPEKEEPNWRELLLRYRLEQQLPEDVAIHLAERKVPSAAEFAELADEFVTHRRIAAKVRGQCEGQSGDGGNSMKKAKTVTPESEKESNNSSSAEEKPARRYCAFCQRSGHTRDRCYSNPDSAYYKGSKKTMLQPNAETFVPKAEKEH